MQQILYIQSVVHKYNRREGTVREDLIWHSLCHLCIIVLCILFSLLIQRSRLKLSLGETDFWLWFVVFLSWLCPAALLHHIVHDSTNLPAHRNDENKSAASPYFCLEALLSAVLLHISSALITSAVCVLIVRCYCSDIVVTACGCFCLMFAVFCPPVFSVCDTF